MWRYYKIAFSKGGIWETQEPEKDTLFITFFPVLNTLSVFWAYINFPPRKKAKSTKTYSKFYGIKNK